MTNNKRTCYKTIMKNEIIARFFEFHVGGDDKIKLILPGLVMTCKILYSRNFERASED